MQTDATPMTVKPHVEWFHGSPQKLTRLRAGSTVTPVLALARAFSHKPGSVDIQIRENTETGQRRIEIRHNGTDPGYLYRVVVTDPARDLVQHPGSTGARGEEMLTARELALEFMEEVPVRSMYEYAEAVE